MNLLKSFLKSTNYPIKIIVRGSRGGVSDEMGTIKHVEFERPVKQYFVPPALYGGRQVVTMLPGHGIGPEMMAHVRDIVAYARAPVDFEVHDVINTQEDLQNAIVSITRNGCCIKGSNDSFPDPTEGTLITPDVTIRKQLDLHVSLNIFKPFKNVNAKYPDIDIVVVRQNTEGEYAMIEHENSPGIVESMKICTRRNSERLAKWTMLFSKLNNRKKITIVHRANLMKLSDGLFLKTVKDIAGSHPELEINDLIIDNLTVQVVSNPHQFDVLICPNLYGSVLTNVLCGLTGGAGLSSACMFGNRLAVFEAASRSIGTLLAGKNIANPVAFINAAIALLQYLGHEDHAEIIKEAVRKTIEVDGIKTFDVGGTASTTDVVQNIKVHLCNLIDHCEL